MGYSKKYDFHYTDTADYNRKYNNIWVKNNPDKVSKVKKKYNDGRGKEWLQEQYDKFDENGKFLYHKNKSLIHEYGITLEQFNTMLEEQEYKCGNSGCDTKLNGKGNTHVDHDHSYEKGDPAGVLRLLCNLCNVARGYLKNDIERMRGMMEYQKWINSK